MDAGNLAVLNTTQGGATRPADSCETGGTSNTGFFRQGWHAMKRRWNSLIQSLVLIRFGQELGTDSEIAQAVAHSIDFVVSTLARFLS
jgi:hypothetical protein